MIRRALLNLRSMATIGERPREARLERRVAELERTVDKIQADRIAALEDELAAAATYIAELEAERDRPPEPAWKAGS